MTRRDERVIHVQKHSPFSRRLIFEARNGGWQVYVNPFKFGRVEFSPQRCPNLWQSSVGSVGAENPLGSSLDNVVCDFRCDVLCMYTSLWDDSNLAQFSSCWDLRLWPRPPPCASVALWLPGPAAVRMWDVHLGPEPGNSFIPGQKQA